VSESCDLVKSKGHVNSVRVRYICTIKSVLHRVRTVQISAPNVVASHLIDFYFSHLTSSTFTFRISPHRLSLFASHLIDFYFSHLTLSTFTFRISPYRLFLVPPDSQTEKELDIKARIVQYRVLPRRGWAHRRPHQSLRVAYCVRIMRKLASSRQGWSNPFAPPQKGRFQVILSINKRGSCGISPFSCS